MNRLVLMLLLILLPANALALIDYQLDIQLIPAEQSLLATAVITPDASIAQNLELQLSGNCEIIEIRQAGAEPEYTFSAGRLTIERLNSQPVSISYRGHFTDQVSSSPIHNEDPSYGVSAGISEQGSFLSASANWYPRLSSEDIHYRLQIKTPPGIEAVSSGRRIERRNTEAQTVSVWEVDYPLYGLTVSAGAYQVFEERSGRIPVYAYFYAESAQLARLYIQEARNYLNLYEELFGPYPFHKFAIVENFFPTGYGFPSWTLLGSSVIRLPFIVKTSLGHEIAHSWWGTGVRVDYSQGNWAEGLTSYVADYLYKERTSEAAALEYRLKILRDYSGLVNADNAFPLNKFLSRNDKASQAIGYGKAAMLFHMLRNQVGDELFWVGLKKIAQEKMFQSISWSDFAEQFSSAGQGDLSPFLDQWLRRSSGPELSLTDVTVEKAEAGYLLQGTIQQSVPTYQLQLELQIETATGAKRYPTKVADATQTFQLKTAEPPLTLIADPDADLFRILKPEEIPPTTNAVRGSTRLLAIKAETQVPSSAAINTLLGALRKADVPVKNLAEVATSELASHDLLIFGKSEELQPAVLSAENSLPTDLYAVLAGESTFLVLPHPTTKNRIAAWFLSTKNSDDAVVARKIPHYGKYSYLAFAGGTNRAKETFSPKDSPLRVEFKRAEKHGVSEFTVEN